MSDSEELLARIVKEGGRNAKEIKAMVEKRKAATHGLLSDYGALYAVAKELGIDVGNTAGEKIKTTKLSDIKPSSSLNVAGRVKSVAPAKEFQRKDGSSGKLASVVIADASGETRLVLWDNQADLASRLKKGDAVLVRNGHAKAGLSGAVEVSAGSLSSVVINPKTTLDLPEYKEESFKINDLTKNLSSVDLLARVKSYYPPTTFQRSDGSEGSRASFIAEDETGTVRVIVWGDAAKTALDRGDYVSIESAYTKEGLNHDIELHIGSKSRISLSADGSTKLKLSPIQGAVDLHVVDVKPDMSGFSLAGRVLHIYPPKNYASGSLSSIIIGDLTGTVRAVLWNEKSAIAAELKKGDAVKIKNAYAKAGLSGEPEVHVGRYGDVVLNPDLDIAPLKDIEGALVNEKKIIDLQDKESHVRIRGRAVDIDEGKKILYYTCSKCSKKIQNMGDIWFCESCSEEVTAASNLVVSVSVEDETGSIRAIAFRENAEKVLGLDLEEVMNIIGETQDETEPVRQIRENLLTKELSLIGRVRYSEFSDQLEFMIEEVEVL